MISNASTNRGLAGMMGLLVCAGAAAACPPESEEGAQRIRVIEREGDGPISIQMQRVLEDMHNNPQTAWMRLRPVMQLKHADDEAEQVYRFATGGGTAEAQTHSRTRGNGEARARALAVLGGQKPPAAKHDDDPAPAKMKKRALLERERAVAEEQRARAQRFNAERKAAAAARSNSDDAVVEGRALVVGPDGVEHELRLGRGEAGKHLMIKPRVRGGDTEMLLELETAMADAAPGAWLGVELAEPDAAVMEFLGLEAGNAARIGRVFEGSPAAGAGLQGGDIVISISGAAGAGPEALREAVAGSEPGDVLRMKVLRKGREHDLKVKLGAREEDQQAEPADEARGGEAGSAIEQRLERLERMVERLLAREGAGRSAPAPRGRD